MYLFIIISMNTNIKILLNRKSKVFLNIFGEHGDTGDRMLERSETNRDKFERNQVDVFRIEAVQLKKIKKIRIGILLFAELKVKS